MARLKIFVVADISYLGCALGLLHWAGLRGRQRELKHAPRQLARLARA